MSFEEEFQENLFNINEKSFENRSLSLFEYQYKTNHLYRAWSDSLNKSPKNVHELKEIPFLPIRFFKNHAIKSGEWETQKIFKSSGTTSSARSAHHIKSIEWYHSVAKKITESFFDPIENYQIIALLPSYLEQGDSSLVSMVNHFICNAAEGSGYFLNSDIEACLTTDKHKIVFGVTYALLDLGPVNSGNNTIYVETGGMKGRRKEMIRNELHAILRHNLNTSDIWSEYGMTELQSQAYGKGGNFQSPAWMQILIRDINDPFTYQEDGNTGGINVIDLSNVSTCAFIETKDLGRKNGGIFEVLGRFDNSDVRGCSLLI